jgi:hypothetical protein
VGEVGADGDGPGQVGHARANPGVQHTDGDALAFGQPPCGRRLDGVEFVLLGSPDDCARGLPRRPGSGVCCCRHPRHGHERAGCPAQDVRAQHDHVRLAQLTVTGAFSGLMMADAS